MSPTMSSKSSKARALYSFTDARRMARNHQFETREEYLEYSCPGAYQLPKNPEEVWVEEWKGWEDWLGSVLDFELGRKTARTLNLQSESEYEQLIRSNTIDDSNVASRLPYQPDKIYTKQWRGWADWLGVQQ